MAATIPFGSTPIAPPTGAIPFGSKPIAPLPAPAPTYSSPSPGVTLKDGQQPGFSALKQNLAQVPGDVMKLAGNVTSGLGFGQTADTIGSIVANKTADARTKPLLPLPSAGKTAGAVLNVASLLTPVGGAERVAGGVLSRVLPGAVAKVGAKVIAGATTGYTMDAGRKLEEGKAPLPGLNTALGAVLPLPGAAKDAIASRAAGGAERIIAKRQAALQTLEDSYSTIRKVTANAQSKGVDVKKILSQTDLLHGAVDTTGTIRTQNAIKELNDFIRPHENVISQNLQKEGSKVPLELIKRNLTKSVMESSLQGGSLERALQGIDTDMKGLARRADKDGYISLSTVHDAKVDKYANINYLNPESKRTDKIIAKGFKDIVEQRTKSVDVKALNKELSSHYAVQNFLEKMDGKKVEGGKLGKYFAQTVGGIVGSHFGPLGTIAGAELGGRIKGATMAAKFNGKTGAALERSDAMNQAVEKGKKTVIPMGSKEFPQENSLGSRNTSQSTTIPPTKNAIQTTLPQKQTFRSPGDMLLKAGKDYFTKNPPSVGLTMKSTAAKIHPADLSTMMDYTDYAIGKYNPSDIESKRLNIAADRIWKTYFPNRKLPDTADGIAKHFGSVLDKTGFDKKAAGSMTKILPGKTIK